VNVGDVLEQIEIPWRHTTTNYAFDRRELAMNGGESKIVDLLKVRRTDGMLSLIELMEANFWGAPVNENDKITPWGVPLWVVKSATEGFNGDKLSTWATYPGGLNHAKFKNWTSQYAKVTKSDLILKMRRAHRQTGFESPINIPDYRSGRGDQYRIYVNEDTLETLESLGESQNENLGRDLAPMDGTITFRRNPLLWVPFLDDDDTDPVYMLNYGYFHPVFLKGEYLREGEPKPAPEQHTVSVVHIDLTSNTLCTDRRRQAVLSKAAA
ncbi:MAG: phage major capsid protein, partial [Sedimentisphaerales bacterium]|nr:phage major capsid protein [Sedimentisphaerales bacterium]